jgi:hypothetical protein
MHIHKRVGIAGKIDPPVAEEVLANCHYTARNQNRFSQKPAIGRDLRAILGTLDIVKGTARRSLIVLNACPPP